MKKQLFLVSSFLFCVNLYSAEINLGEKKIYSETGYELSLRNTLSSPYVVNSKEIEKKKYNSVSEILQDISVANILEGIGGLPSIDIRGQGPYKSRETVQLLVDGIPSNMLDTSHINVPVNTIDVNDIERIEIIPSGGAVLYGSGTSGGVVNIITKKNNKTFANAEYKTSSYVGNKYDINAGTSFDKFSVSINYSENDRKSYRKDEFSNSEYFGAKVKYDINDTNNFIFKYNNYRNKYLSPDYLTEEEVRENRRQSGISEDVIHSNNKVKKDEFSIIYNSKINKNNELNIVAYSQETDIKGNSQEKKKMGRRTTIMSSESRFNDEKKGITVKDKLLYGEGNRIIFGLGYKDNDMLRKSKILIGERPMMDTEIKLSKKTLNIFALNTFSYHKFDFTQGLRYERSKYSGTRASNAGNFDFNKKRDDYAGTLGINYLYSDSGNIYFKYERAFTSPAPGKLSDKIRNKDGNLEYKVNNLKSEKSNIFELGWNDYIANSLLSASVYLSETKDEINTIFEGGFANPHNLEFRNINIGRTRRYGLDLKAEQKFEKIKFTEAYSFVNAKIIKDNVKTEGKYIANVPKHRITFSLDYDLNEKINLGADYIYTAASYIDNENKYGKDKEKSLLNVRVNYKLTQNINIFAGINNLLNKKYYRGVETAKDGNKIIKVYDPAATINYYAGINYKF